MSRCSLSRIVLMSKILDMGTPKQILAGALDVPSFKNIVLTILSLKQVMFQHEFICIHYILTVISILTFYIMFLLPKMYVFND